MNSRLAFGLLLTAAFFCLVSLARAGEAPRTRLSFDSNWLFAKSDTPSAQSPDFDNKSWRTLNHPHFCFHLTHS